MKKLSLLLIVAAMTAMMLSSCGGQSYKEVTIGDQIWMAENLNVDKFRNGDPIPHAQTYEEWQRAGENGQPAWCYYDNDPANGKIYGKLYNWYAVSDWRGLAPEGWHIASNEDWEKLTKLLGGEHIAGGKLKATDTTYWQSPNTGATNETGFTALPGGVFANTFAYIGIYGFWWSATEDDAVDAWYQNLYFGDISVDRDFCKKEFGSSVRCLRE